jgi:hypothetical protein
MAQDLLETWSSFSPRNHLSPTKTPKQAHDQVKSADHSTARGREGVGDVYRGGTTFGDPLGLIRGFRGSLLLGKRRN